MPESSASISTPLFTPSSLDDPLYYLKNFKLTLEWVRARYSQLLSDQELCHINAFCELPEASQGLFVRMMMRQGTLFRLDKLCYSELGCTTKAVEPLVSQQWVSANPDLSVAELFKLFTWSELKNALAPVLAEAGFSRGNKRDALAVLELQELAPRTSMGWGLNEVTVVAFEAMSFCERIRLMFFGNLHQDWTEFVLTELGTYQYETVAFSEQSRPFNAREEIDTYLTLQQCQNALSEQLPLAEVFAAIPHLPTENPWLVRRQQRLVYTLAREWERAGDLDRAAELYGGCTYAGARARYLRVLELRGEHQAALQAALVAQQSPESEAERQQLLRLIPRLQRALEPGRRVPRAAPPTVDRVDLKLAKAPSVEQAVVDHLHRPEAPVFYVENCLLSGLFGLLCWDAIFAPVPGAFFHPFQRGPADLHWPDFVARRASLFKQRLDLLEQGRHRAAIMETFHRKFGVQSPFVHWTAISVELLELALDCIPARDLRLIFERILTDIKANRAGFPDLIQFDLSTSNPHAPRSYCMIEVKGPGDRLQDNQKRWLEYFAQHEIPVQVCYVVWSDSDD